MITKHPGLIVIFTLLFINQYTKAELQKAKFIPITNPEIIFDHDADLAQKEKAIKEKELQEKTKKLHIPELTPQDKALFEESFAQAPIKIKALINDRLKGEPYAMRYKNILLTGPSGSGKTTLLLAIAYKLNRKCLLVHGPTLLGRYRDQAVENIRALFQQLSKYEEMPILGIDEINALTDDHNSEHSDTKHTAMQFWTLLDKFKNHKDFLLIGTTNITKKMPHQLQSRFKGRTFLVDYPSFEARKRSIKFCIQMLHIRIDTTCDDQFLETLAKKTENFSQRDIEALIDTALLLFSIKNPDCPVALSKEYFEQAYRELTEENEKFWDFSEQTTAEERRHIENLAQNKMQFKESQELQIRLAEWNLIFQSLMKTYEKSSTASWIEAIKEANKAKSIVFPDKKPVSKITIIPATGGFWNGTREETKLETNDQTEKKHEQE